MLAIQFLEHSPELPGLEAEQVRARLRDAFQRLPLDIVILGWSVPPALVDACAAETSRAGARLYRWQPLLTGSGACQQRLLAESSPAIDPGWRVIGMEGKPVPAYQDLPEFTFLCPNNEAVTQAVLAELARAVRPGPYQGVFLDRIRYPSPSADLLNDLGCFCAFCQKAAAEEGLDLCAVRGVLRRLNQTLRGRRSLLAYLFDATRHTPGIENLDLVSRFLTFRARSVARFVEKAAQAARHAGLKVGLDCFSPVLAYMVGQDLGALNASADWVKIMSYGHSLAPAGMPYELLGLAEWLAPAAHTDPAGALPILSRAIKLALPASVDDLRRQGIGPPELADEVARGRQAGITTLMVGIELVELASVTALKTSQIKADLRAFRRAGPDGLVLSWDLWRIPPPRLDLVREVWLELDGRV